MAFERQGEKKAVHQHLVGNRVQHSSQWSDAVESLGDVPVQPIGQGGQQEQQPSLMIGSGTHQQHDRHRAEQPGQGQQVGSIAGGDAQGVTEVAGKGAGNTANPSAGRNRHPSVSSANDNPTCATDVTNRSVSPR